MITLYGWGPMFGCPSPSPYVMKTEIQLQMFGLEFKRAMADLDAVSKHKAPYLKDGDLLIQDSNFIRAHFEDKLGKSLNTGLTPEEEADAWALERMAEGHLMQCLGYDRWMIPENFNKGPVMFFMAAPEPQRSAIIKDTLEHVAANYQGNGFGRHTASERHQLADWDIRAIATRLGDKPFLFGDEPTAADASVSAVLISAATDFFDTPLVKLVTQHENLNGYMKRMSELYFAESLWPVPEIA
ncbi:MAG: glutathione S-transferase [Ponticaulis sp.]|nr:glutathione S-transferase [Ponticaulis sp.]